MTKLTTTDLSNLTNEASAVATINQNNAAIETAVENTLSRDGTSPNEMNATLDMNSHRIINLPDPQSANEPARLVDITSLLGGGATQPPAPSAITRGGVYTHPVVANEFLTGIAADGTSSGRRPVVADLLGGVAWSDVSGKPSYTAVDTTDAANVNFTPSGTGADVRSVSSKLRESVSVLDYIPPAQHAAILAKTTTYDATVDIQACIDANGGIRPIHVPSGKYIISDTLKFRPTPGSDIFLTGLTLYGDGPQSTTFDNRSTVNTYSDNFATVNTSVIVTVTRNAHGLAAGDTIEIVGTSGAIGGLTFEGIWSIQTVTTNTFTFSHTSGATSTANGTVTYGVVQPLLDLGLTDTIGNYQMFARLSNFKITNDTAITNCLGIRVRKTYHCTIDNVWLHGQTLDGIQVPSVDETAGDRDASNQLTIDHCRVENCSRWAIWVVGRSETASGGSGGNNENSYVKITNTFITNCGVDAATTPPVSGAIRWKGQVLILENSAVAASQNVALWIEGGPGLANSATVTGFTSENVTRKGIYIDGVQGASFRDIQLYNNDSFIAQYGIRVDGTTYVCAGIRVNGCIVRATSGNNAHTAFSLTGANATNSKVDFTTVIFQNYDFGGQTRNNGFGSFQPTVQRFTSGSGTYTTPAGVRFLKVRMVGGGGGGAGSGTTPGSGGAGGNTTFSTFTANGGNGAVANSGAGGGTATGGHVNLIGATGQSGSGLASTAGGNGAGSPFGGNGWGGAPGAGAGVAALTNSGSGGGGGGVNATVNGGGGGGAGGYLEGFIPTPAATYSYAVGAAGTAGTTGTSGAAGGAGGSGQIIVEEFY